MGEVIVLSGSLHQSKQTEQQLILVGHVVQFWMWAQLEWEVLIEADCGALCLSVFLAGSL